MPLFLPQLPPLHLPKGTLGEREMLLPQVSAQHQCRCSISSLAVGPPLLRTDRDGDELWLFHPLGFPSSSTPTSSASWGDPAGSPVPPLFSSSPPQTTPTLAEPQPVPSTVAQAGSVSTGAVLGGCLSCAAILSSPPSAPTLGRVLQTPVRVAQAPVGGEHMHASSLLRQHSAGNPSLLRCMAGDLLS